MLVTTNSINSKNTWPTCAYKVLNLEITYGCEFVIIGLAAQQGCSSLKVQAAVKSGRVPQIW